MTKKNKVKPLTKKETAIFKSYDKNTQMYLLQQSKQFNMAPEEYLRGLMYGDKNHYE